MKKILLGGQSFEPLYSVVTRPESGGWLRRFRIYGRDNKLHIVYKSRNYHNCFGGKHVTKLRLTWMAGP